MEERGANWYDDLPTYVSVCEESCEISDQNYELATFTPDSDDIFGLNWFTVKIDFDNFELDDSKKVI